MSASCELKAFDSMYDLMKSSLTTNDLIPGCYAKNLISNHEREDAEAAGTPGAKAAGLLDAVRKSIVIDSANFYAFLNILCKEAKYNPLDKQLRTFG